MPEKTKNKTNLQHCISLHIAFPQIIALQKDTQALKNTFPATQNDKAKHFRKKTYRTICAHNVLIALDRKNCKI